MDSLRRAGMSAEDIAEDIERAKVITLATPLKQIFALINSLDDLTVAEVPNYSKRVDKDKPQVDWTKDGLSARQKSLDKQVSIMGARSVDAMLLW